MKTPNLLANVRIASPCSANWEDMTGDERSRFCADCRKHVYDLSTLTADEAVDLIREKEGNLCARFYQRHDGTVLTADCPVGAARYSRRLHRLVFAAVPLLIAAAVFSQWASGASVQTSPARRGKLSGLVEKATWKVKGWLGIRPRPVLMGDICVPLSQPPPLLPPPEPPAKDPG